MKLKNSIQIALKKIITEFVILRAIQSFLLPEKIFILFLLISVREVKMRVLRVMRRVLIGTHKRNSNTM